MAKEMSEDINDIIETVKPDLQTVGFTTDLWTSRAGHSFMSLTTHFIDKSWKLSGVNFHLELDSMIDALGLETDAMLCMQYMAILPTCCLPLD